MASAVMSNLMLGIRECWRERMSLVPTVSKDYIVELNFLGKYFTSDCLWVCYDGTGKLHVSAYDREKTCECHRIIITGDDTVNGPTGESLYFYYLDGKGFYAGSNYGLVIANTDDSILYWREVGQDPHTEWLINCLAGDSENTEGNPVFTGEPVTF